MAFECLKKLHQESLFADVVHLGGLMTTIVERNGGFLTQQQRYQTAVYYADALNNVGLYKKSEEVYMKALSLRKCFCKSSTPSTTPSSTTTGRNRSSSSALASNSIQLKDLTGESDVKYSLHLCLLRQNKIKEAIGLLDSIPAKARSPRVNFALGDLHRQLNSVELAKQCYTDLLSVVPSAVGAAIELLNLDVSLDKVVNIAGFSSLEEWAAIFQGTDWFPVWIRGHANLARRDYNLAVADFRSLDVKSVLANNHLVLYQLAKSYYSAGEYTRAISVFLRVHTLEPFHVNGMDVLASMLAEDRSRLKELESLATRLISNYPDSPVAWVAMGYLCKATKKYTKAIYFAHKACGSSFNPYVEAMLLKASVLADSKKWTEGALHYHEALLMNPYRFELYEGLVHCHLERGKMNEARVIAGFCVKQIGQSARTVTLYAMVLARDPSTISQAQTILERAIESAPNLLKSTYLLVDIYDKQGQYDRAIDLLRRQTCTHVRNKLHRLLGDFLSKADRPTEAMDSYRYALSLEPGDAQAAAGLSDLGDRLASSSTENGLWLSPAIASSLMSSDLCVTSSVQVSRVDTAAQFTPETATATMTNTPMLPSSDYLQQWPNAPGRHRLANGIGFRLARDMVSISTPQIDDSLNNLEYDELVESESAQLSSDEMLTTDNSTGFTDDGHNLIT